MSGDLSALDDVTEPNAKQQLLRPDRWLPSVLREPRLKELRVVELDARGARPSVTVLASVRAEPDIRNLNVYWMLSFNGTGREPWILRDAKAWKDKYQFAK